MRVGIIGATGVVGREVVAGLSEPGEARDETVGREPPSLFATEKSAGEAFAWGEDEELLVEAYTPESVRGLDVAVVAVPAAAAGPIVVRLRELGVVALDTSRFHRRQAPLFFDDNPRPLNLAGAPVVALPSAESLGLARIIAAFSSFRPSSVRATVLKAASGGGQGGVKDLVEATGRLLNGQEPESPLQGHRLAFNMVPQVGAFEGPDSEAETDLAYDLRRMLGEMPVAVSSTVAWGPWIYGDFLTVSVRLESEVPLQTLRDSVKGKHLKLVDQPGLGVYPMPLLATGDDALLVGRLRMDKTDRRELHLVAAMDGARASAAHAIEALRTVVRARQVH